MKRLVLCLLALSILLSATGCDLISLFPEETLSANASPSDTLPANTQPTGTLPEETKPVEVEEAIVPLEVFVGNQYISEWTDDYIILGYVDWDCLILGEKSAKEYPKLAAAIDEYCEMDGAWAEEVLQSMLPEARKMAQQMGNEFYGYCQETTCSIQRADSRILSARFDCYAYTGGARPYSSTAALNMDPTTGNALVLSQVLTDKDRLPELLTQVLEDNYPDLHDAAFGDLKQILENYDEQTYTWTLGYQGITFYFDASEIAPAAMGPLEATLWFDRYPELFVEGYTQIPQGGYAIHVPEDTWLAVDMNTNDDSWEQIHVSLDDDGTLHITKNGNTLSDGDYFAFYADSYLVTPDNEHFYLYVDCSAENDYSIFRVYDMNGEEPVLIRLFEGEGFSGVWIEDYILGSTWFNAVFNDPTHFLLAGHLNILGTMSGTRPFHMDPETGLPMADENYYTLPTQREPLVTKTVVTVKLLPEKTDLELPASTQLWFLRSDGETYVDMLLKDGRQCRVYVTYRDWQGYVDGKPEDECFEGIMYAG